MSVISTFSVLSRFFHFKCNIKIFTEFLHHVRNINYICKKHIQYLAIPIIHPYTKCKLLHSFWSFLLSFLHYVRNITYMYKKNNLEIFPILLYPYVLYLTFIPSFWSNLLYCLHYVRNIDYICKKYVSHNLTTPIIHQN